MVHVKRWAEASMCCKGEADGAKTKWCLPPPPPPPPPQVYYEDSITGGLVHVEANKTLKETLSRKG